MFGRAQRDERKAINAATAPGLRPHAGREKNNRIRLVRGRSRHCHENYREKHPRPPQQPTAKEHHSAKKTANLKRASPSPAASDED